METDLPQMKSEPNSSQLSERDLDTEASILKRLQEAVDRNEIGDRSPEAATGAGGDDDDDRKYVVVWEHENGEAVELPLEDDGSLAVTTLQIEFTGAMGLKYR